MSEKDKAQYRKMLADPVRYAAYLERKRRERLRKQRDRKYETLRKRNWRAANPDRARAHRDATRAVHEALRDGQMVKPDRCSRCGLAGPLEGHHANGYDRDHWLDVLWLCQMCHSREHYPRTA